MDAEPVDEIAAVHASGVAAARELAAAGLQPPALAVQSHFSFLKGAASPAAWGAALAGLHGLPLAAVRGSREAGKRPAQLPPLLAAHLAAMPALATVEAGAAERATRVQAPPVQISDQTDTAAGPWAALADEGDLAGLPAALQSWGRRQLAVAAQLPMLGPLRASASSMLLLAPTATAYAALCRFLSWRHEDDEAWDAWQHGRGPAGAGLDGILVLLRDAAWIRPLQELGGECYWHAQEQPVPTAPLPVAALPLLSQIRPLAPATGGVLQVLRDKRDLRQGLARLLASGAELALSDLAAVVARFHSHPEQLQLGHELLHRCRFAPGAADATGAAPPLMPPSRWPDPDRQLQELASRGLRSRYGRQPPPAALERLQHELAVIRGKGFSSYILTVYELAHGRRTCGRGSAASSLVCYALGLTHVDPLRYHLLFERFLAPERIDPPDIDIDFPWDERDQVIQQAIQHYGQAHVAMVSTHQRLGSRGALRETARALGMQRGAITRAAARLAQQHRFGVDAELDEEWLAIAAGSAALIGAPRHFGLHCGGIVITPMPIREVVPVHPASKRIEGTPVPAISWEKDGAEAMGLVKIDLLGNRSLAVVRDCLQNLREHGIHIDELLWRPQDDLLARRLIEDGRSIGCFYIESPATRLLNAKAGSVDFDRLVVHSSIIRPAAAVWLNTYLERLHYVLRTGEDRPEWYPHPALRELLSEAYGVLCYQEDVMLIARRLAGFDSPRQNRLRKALGRSDTPQRLAELASEFIAGCRTNGVEESIIAYVWTMITSFAGYSFCKAHSASYVMVSYQCAYLKAHHPAHHLAAVISNEGGFYQHAAYVEEARRSGVRIEAPCVVSGDWQTWAVAGDRIRLGLHLVHGVCRRLVDRLIEERQHRRFRGINDFVQRCRPSLLQLRMLLWAGALDRLLRRHSPAERSWLAAEAARQPRCLAEETGQHRLDFAPDCRADPEAPAGLPPLSQLQLDRRALAALACLPRAHPLCLWQRPAEALACRQVDASRAGQQVRICGQVITRKQVLASQSRDRQGRELPVAQVAPMSFVTIEDDSGVCESIWFPQSYQRYGVLLESGVPLVLSGEVLVEFGAASLRVDSVAPLLAIDAAAADGARRQTTAGSDRRPQAAGAYTPRRARCSRSAPL